MLRTLYPLLPSYVQSLEHPSGRPYIQGRSAHEHVLGEQSNALPPGYLVDKYVQLHGLDKVVTGHLKMLVD
jgi:hypothetical protein